MSSGLDLVTMLSAELMDATAETVVPVCERVLKAVVGHSAIDVGFLRFNDHDAQVSTVVAEWPPRPYRPDPDPLAVAPFTSANPVFAVCESLKQPTVVEASLPYYGYFPPAQEAVGGN